MSSTVARSTRPTLRRADYDTDFCAWSLDQARLIREGRFEEVDLENVAEEVESLGRSARTELRSRLSTLVEHLLKLEAPTAPEPHRGWIRTVRRCRVGIEELLRESPSLRREIRGMLSDVHPKTVRFTADVLEDFGEIDAAAHVRGQEGADFTDEELFGDWFPEAKSG